MYYTFLCQKTSLLVDPQLISKLLLNNIKVHNSSKDLVRTVLSDDQVRRALKKAEEEIGMPRLEQLAELQQWLQLTYEVENRHYEAKREAAEKQLFIAKEMVSLISHQ